MHILFDLRSLNALPAPDWLYLVALVDGLLPALTDSDRITILTARKSPLLLPPLEHPSVRYVEAKHHGRSLGGAWELNRWVHNLAPDVYWSADPLMRPPARRHHPITIIFAVEQLLHFAEAGRYGRMKRWKWWLMAVPRLWAADALICPSHALEVRLIAGLGLGIRRKTHVIPNGVHLVFRRHNEAEIATVRRRWLVPKRYVLMVGHAIGQHNLKTPLQALAENEEVSSPTCILVGDAKPSPELRAFLREQHLDGMVRFIDINALTPSDLSALYSGASATFEPSLRADYRPTILQSMACGTPVIGAATQANQEYFGNAILRVHPTNASEWSKALTALTLSADLRERLIQRGLAIANTYTWSATAKASLALARCHTQAPSP